MIKNSKRTREDIQRVQELRRSNASARHRNHKRYTRKSKYGKGVED